MESSCLSPNKTNYPASYLTNYLANFLAGTLMIQGEVVSPERISLIAQSKAELIADIKKNNLVCFLSQKCPLQFSISFFSLLDAGIFPILIPPNLTNFQKEKFKKYKANWLEDEILTKIHEGDDFDTIPNQLSYACLTSGTTTDPKLCWLSVEGAIKNASAHVMSLGIEQHHLIIQMLPMYHSYGVVAYLFTHSLLQGHLDFNSHIVNLKSLESLTTKLATKSITAKELCLYSSPAHLQFLLKDQSKFAISVPALGILSVGGGIADLASMIELKKSFPKAQLYITYGLSEAGPRVSTGKITETLIKAISNQTPAYLGEPINGVEVKVLSESGELAPNGIGRLCIKSPALKLNMTDEEIYLGHYITPDIVELKQGQLFFLSRKDHLIKVGGISVYPQDIEKLVKLYPGVNDCIVIPAMHKLYGEIPHLIIEGECDKKEILNFLKTKLSVYQIPKKIDIFEVFPRHSLNKINIKELLKKCS